MHWSVLGASVAGTSHIARGVPCQDAYRAARFGPAGEWLAVAVADGAGSASHADRGAALACASLVRRATTADPAALFDRDRMCGLLAGVRAELAAEAERLGVQVRQVACTVLLAVVGPGSAVVAQIGDGAVVLGSDGSYWMPVWPEPGEYANCTDFLTDEGFPDAVRYERVGGTVVEVAVLTDGMQRLALDFRTRTPNPGFFTPLFRPLHSADPAALDGPFRMFLDSPRVVERTDDDRTLVLAVRRP